MKVFGTVTFKKPLINEFGLVDVSAHKEVLQVGLVHINEYYQRFGWGLKLYSALANVGFIILSDNEQYLGGAALWKRIAAETLNGNYSVFIIDQGKVRLTDGQPVEYTGSNIDDSELWSENNDKKYTLFLLKKRII